MERGEDKPFKSVSDFGVTGAWCVEIHAFKDLQEPSNLNKKNNQGGQT